ncbi:MULTISPECIES: hypothetical protein [unclassified Streptomyces]|uniref:hypothetical protein n=1 Tax=unclassified Streptomyces TaxID=2593676 RepID=UPI00352FD23E
MRWDNLAENDPPRPGAGGAAALFDADAVITRTFDTPKIHKGTASDAPSLSL